MFGKTGILEDAESLCRFFVHPLREIATAVCALPRNDR